MMTLAKYQQKRNFKKTPEPKGNIKKKKPTRLLYIIQKHAASHLHYDFRLELNGVLLSWAVPKGPCLDPNVKRLAMHVEDHPVEYGSFEGIIPKGQYGGGTVMLWDKGEWISEDENPVKAYQQGNMKFRLVGKKLKGLWKLIRINNNDKTWLLIKSKDEYSQNIKKYEITEEMPDSVVTGQSIDQISENYKHLWGKNGLEKPVKRNHSKTARKLPKLNIAIKSSKIPKMIFPQLATLVDRPPVGKQWLHEIKLDGYRIIAIKTKGKTKLLSRNNKDWTDKFPNIADEIDKLPIQNIILDGELVVLDESGKSNFQLLQNSIKDNTKNKFYYYIFDLLYYDQYNLTQLSLAERKKYLKKILNSTHTSLIYNDHVLGSGKEIFEKACALSLEGIISKDASSPYLSKRSTNWLKSKCIKRQEFVIGGYTNPQGARNHFGSLLIGTYNKHGKLIYNGNVGTGFTFESLRALHKLLKKNQSSKNPFTTKPPKIKQVNWVKPNLVAEIEFTEWTEEGSLRHPSFKGLRSDKKPKNIIKEIPTHVGKKVEPSFKLTHPEKILYPEDNITKEDLATYYNEIQKWILPYIINRPLTLLRCPEGYKECFYQKHITHTAPNSIHGIMLKEKKGKAEYVYINDVEGLLALVQLSVLEIHTWGSTIKKVEYPDMIIFDLDPSPEVKWEKVVTAAKLIKKNLLKFKLKSFVKTTGGKGLHVVIPIKPEYNWEEVKNFAKTFVNILEQNNPHEYISTLSKAKRKGKIFIDYLRNQRGATAVAPYSTRARKSAPVSVPIGWNELTNHFEDTFFTIKNLPDRLKKLKKDPWKDFLKTRQSLNLKNYR